MGVLINEDRFQLVNLALTPVSVAANTAAEQTFTINGLRTTDYVAPVKPSAQAGLSLGGARVSAANTLAITFDNNTASPIVPTAETYQMFIFRAEKPVTNPVSISM